MSVTLLILKVGKIIVDKTKSATALQKIDDRSNAGIDIFVLFPNLDFYALLFGKNVTFQAF